MKRTLTVLLMACMLVSLFSGMALAADDTSAPQSNLKSVFSPALYVAANADAALDGTVRVTMDTLGSTGTLYLPGTADASKLCFSWDDAGLVCSKDGVVYASGTAPVAPEGKSVTYKFTKGLAVAYVTIATWKGSAEVAPMFLDLDESLGTIDAMNSDKTHETSCYGKVQFDGASLFIGIKGRGNSTWGYDKKPYNITVFKNDGYEKKAKAEFIPGVQAKKWSLLANHLDSSLLRNKIAMDLANSLGIGLDARFVDVWMNGEYLGNYLMTPKNDYQAPDGGYALENDNYLESEDPQFQIPGMYEIGAPIHDDGYYNRITVKDIGDDAADAGVGPAEIETYFTTAWNALLDYGSERYQDYFDMDSWAKMFLMYEVSKTYDCFSGSLLMHRDGLTDADKLIAGPAWDYDVSFGRTLHKFLVGVTTPTQMTAEGWYNDSIGLIAVDQPISLLQELGKHPSFMAHVAKVYTENKALFDAVPDNVLRQQTLLRDSALMNNARWDTHHIAAEYVVAPNTMHIIGTGKYALNYHVTLTWDDYAYNVHEYCVKRVMWMNDHLYIQSAEGSVTRTSGDAGDTLTAVLTAGADGAGFQWQRAAADGVWTDVPEANAAQLTIAAGDTAQYRCVVTAAGPVIVTTHGGTVPTSAQTILDAPAESSGRTPDAPAPDPDSGKTGICKFFTDVDRSIQSWYANAVDWAVSKNITNGVSDSLFAPDQVCTRAQVVTFLWRAAGKPAPTSTANPFTDVHPGDYYYDAVLWAVEKGITTGMTEDTFAPDAPCTRAQVVTFLWRAAGKPASNGANPFSDVPANEWFTDAVLWATGRSITNGTTQSTFAPDDSCTRAHVVTFLYRSASGK